MEFEFRFILIKLFKLLWGKLLERLDIKRAFSIDAFVNIKMFAILLFTKSIATVWAKVDGLKSDLFLLKCES